METIEINNPFEDQIPNELIEKVAEGAIVYLKDKEVIKDNRDFELSIALVEKEKIAKLNQEYRDKSESTDVLSFCYDNNNEKINGEIILCLEEIEENAKHDKIEVKAELAKNIVHGILHIVGFDHGKKMFSLQDKIISQLIA